MNTTENIAAADISPEVIADLRAQVDAPADFAERYKVVRRTGGVVPFDANKISVAIMKGVLAVEGAPAAHSARARGIVGETTKAVVKALIRGRPLSGTFHIEDIQDQVELALMRGGYHEVARSYVLYREERAKNRRTQAEELMPRELRMVGKDGASRPLDVLVLRQRLESACYGLAAEADPAEILRLSFREFHDGMLDEELHQSLIIAACALIKKEPDYSFVAARLLLDNLRSEVFGAEVLQHHMAAQYPPHLQTMLEEGVAAGLLDSQLRAKFDLRKLGGAIRPERDLQFGYLGLRTLYDRYFLHIDGRRIELPQSFFMRVAMGLALNEKNPNERAIEFYEALSSFRFMSSTPTLFNSGTVRSQLSSCYLTTVGDDLDGIFTAIRENALLAKFAGGLGNDWTRVRAMGSPIKGTNGRSQGVVPFMKVADATAVAVNQGGKRKGAVCAYLETWHRDIEEFLNLRTNTGDERRRTPDMNTANWIPDLFMKRVISGGNWTLFSPSEAPDLHDKVGAEFEQSYTECEQRAAKGEMPSAKTIPAVDLWRKMLTMLFETGHPWITFKDACNVRSPQGHAGVVHSSNLCTEITLNTSADEIAVCNLGSVNLPMHMKDGELQEEQIAATVKTGMRMLDNVIDLNYYAVEKARVSNFRHRPVGLGLMGFQDCLYEMRVAYDSDAAVEFADRSMEMIAYHAYSASCDLARERGAYESFKGSLWDRGILPPDTISLLRESRGGYVEVDETATKDWNSLREKIRQYGMRNSNCLAIAPTATIANIVGVASSIEPAYRNMYVKSNLSGEFTVCNRHLIAELKSRNLWDSVMAADLSHFGRIRSIDRIPEDVRRRYPTAFEIDAKWLVEAAARRQKWIDQAQSLNLYFAEPNGNKLDDTYRLAWRRGLKTTYYLRSLGASDPEKYTAQTGELNAVSPNGEIKNGAAAVGNGAKPSCTIDDPECEACQ